MKSIERVDVLAGAVLAAVCLALLPEDIIDQSMPLLRIIGYGGGLWVLVSLTGGKKSRRR